MPGAGETAASVDFDGPSVPSENYYLFIFCHNFFYIFLSDFLDILSDFTALPVWNCPFRKFICPYLSIWSENVQSEHGSTVCEVWNRRNSSISAFWWAISAIRELLLLLFFNHHSLSEKPVSLYFSLIFWLFYWILLVYVFVIAYLGNLHLPYLSTSTETLFLWLGSIICEVCGRRNSSISSFWWAISAISGLLLLLLLNHWANLFGLCGFLIF